ncbi:MAG TPA: efflux RND transporter periplasmic adaptor subunit [Candidatus Hydrogenedentes bacterium]|mgnify:CR=1 FL=1|nr:efflux RND transporter periplasmic adaptor subunit [Candidatus Hydrogenedentota bacterium]
MSSNAVSPIKSRAHVRIKRWTRKYGAVTVWITVACGLLWTIQQQPQYGPARGVTERVETSVAPVADGMLEHVVVELLDEVKTGQTIALMDDHLLRAEVDTARAELVRLQAQLDANQEEMRRSSALEEQKDQDSRRRFAMDEEEARLNHLQMSVQQDEDKVDLERINLELQREETLLAKGMTSRENYDNVRLRYEALRKKVQENENALAAALRMHDEAVARQNALQEQPRDLDLERMLAPLQKAIAVQEAAITEIQERRKQLILLSPGAGQVTAILKQSGETVMAGDPIVTLSLDNTLRVVAYINERAIQEVPVGTRARLSSRYRPDLTTGAEVVKVGRQIEPLPIRLLLNPVTPEYGIIVILALKDPVFYPGECVNVALDNSLE